MFSCFTSCFWWPFGILLAFVLSVVVFFLARCCGRSSKCLFGCCCCKRNHTQSGDNRDSTGNHTQSGDNRDITDFKLILPVVCFAILILAALVYFSVKKVASQRSSREQAPVRNRSNVTSEENVQYANIVRLQNTGPPPFWNAETPYATIAPLKQQPGLSYEPAKEPSWNE